MQSKFLDASLSGITAEEISGFEAYLAYCCEHGFEIGFLAGSYDLFIRDTMKEQMFFARHKRYRHATYKEVESSVYLQDAYMRRYMYGLALSTFLWPSHRAIMQFFRRTLPRRECGRYLEVGPGHGFYMLTAMELTDCRSYYAVDISPSSAELTRSLLASRSFSREKCYQVEVADFIELQDSAPFNIIVLGEVLEHVEEPLRFLRKLASHAERGTHIFLSTCLNAPEIDHITLFPDTESIHRLLQDAGLLIRETLVISQNGVSVEEAEANALPVNVAYVVERQ